MHPFFRLCARLAVLAAVVAAVAVAAPAAYAADPAGTVAYTAGVVAIEAAGGAKRFAVAGSAVESGDTVQTMKNAEAVLLMSDHQRIYLKGDTVYRIDDYRFAEQDPQRNVSVSSLLKGGLRVISGLIGKQGNPDAYQLKTQTATIGIRGTEWSVLECGIECPSGESGEHLRVYHGTIDVRNEVDHLELSEGYGTIIRSPHGTFGTMPATSVKPVVPSPAACR
ncbi:FecR family protein [Trinickia terrae]|nr:FecR family protein [Trinickia terrae]